MMAKITKIMVPATQPSCANAQAKDNTPEPITAVIMCALAVRNVPVLFSRPSSSTFFTAALPDSTAEGLWSVSKDFIVGGGEGDMKREESKWHESFDSQAWHMYKVYWESYIYMHIYQGLCGRSISVRWILHSF